jgi:preprotein translocase subunit SecE
MAEKKRNASQSEVAEPKTRGNDNRSAKAVTREREERRARENRLVKRESKQSSNLWTRLRGLRLVSFLFEAYRELRYKVTWPTFEEARNMTIAVILLSAFVAAVLALADIGLLRLFQLMSGH